MDASIPYRSDNTIVRLAHIIAGRCVNHLNAIRDWNTNRIDSKVTQDFFKNTTRFVDLKKCSDEWMEDAIQEVCLLIMELTQRHSHMVDIVLTPNDPYVVWRRLIVMDTNQQAFRRVATALGFRWSDKKGQWQPADMTGHPAVYADSYDSDDGNNNGDN